MSNDEKTNSRIVIKNVRGSFMNVLKRSVFEGKEGKYEMTALIDKKDAKIKKKLDQAIAAKMAEAKIKVKTDNICLKDGDESEYDGYADHWSLKAGRDKKPLLIDRDGKKSTEDDDFNDEDFYSGGYYDVSIDFWAQNNTWGKRINANLYGVKFRKDGEPFGIGNVDVSDDFDDEDEI